MKRKASKSDVRKLGRLVNAARCAYYMAERAVKMAKKLNDRGVFMAALDVKDEATILWVTSERLHDRRVKRHAKYRKVPKW